MKNERAFDLSSSFLNEQWSFVFTKCQSRGCYLVKVKLKEAFGLTGYAIEQEEKKLDRIVRRKTREIRKRIFRKLDNLLQEKKQRIFEKNQAEIQKAEKIKISGLDKKIIYNNSKRVFNQREMDLLSLGLNFGITPKKFPLIEYIAATEKLCQSLEEIGDPDSMARAQGIRNLVSGELRKGYDMKIKSNLSKEEREILKQIGDDETIIICPADKGKAIVIEDKETYIQKMYQQIDEGDYTKATKSEQTLLDNIHQKLVAQLKSMGLTDFKQRRPYLVTAPVMANMYLLIKVHKDNFPGRAVVSQIDDPTYLICKELTRILNPLDEAGDSFIKDSFHLKDMLRDIEIDEFCRLASLDIKSLYPKVPVKKALECTREALEADSTLKDRTDWDIDDIIKLLEICIETHFKTIDGYIYTQTDGMPIGKSISGPIAGIYLHWFERTYIFNDTCEFKPHFWKRMRDDILIVWKQGDSEFDRFYWYLMGIEPRIKFTVEREKDGILPFMDIHIRREKDKLVTKVYRKDTHTNRYLNWRSNHSKSFLLGIVKGQTHRAHYFCDLKEDLLEELSFLRDVFVMNGYPLRLVNEVINNSWAKETKKSILRDNPTHANEEKKRSEYYDILHAPYIQGFTENLQKKLRNFNIGIVNKKGDSIKQAICHMKQKIPRTQQKNRVYKFDCKDCKSWYIGETGQKIEKRTYQHQNDIKNGKETNAIFMHLQQHNSHSIKWQEVSYLEREEDWKKRKIKEALYINAMNPKELMNLEKGFEINQCWNEFNPQIRNIALKKGR